MFLKRRLRHVSKRGLGVMNKQQLRPRFLTVVLRYASLPQNQGLGEDGAHRGGGGFRDSRLGELAIARAEIILKAENFKN